MVALPYAHIKVVQYGTILGSQAWSTGFTMAAAGNFDVPAASSLAAFLTAKDAAFQAWWTATGSARSQNTSSLTYVGVKAYAYQVGATVATTQSDHPFATALTGLGSPFLPTQSCIVSSLLSGFSGRKNRGRRYIPAIGATLSAGHKLASAVVDPLVAAEVALIQALNGTTIEGDGYGVIIGSNQAVPPLVSAVRMDNEVDIQRRRADKIAATYFKLTAI